MERPLPLLWQHDHTNVIGWIQPVNGKLEITIAPDRLISEEMFFEAFGGAGVRFTELDLIDGVRWVRAAEVFEFSLYPTPAKPA